MEDVSRMQITLLLWGRQEASVCVCVCIADKNVAQYVKGPITTD